MTAPRAAKKRRAREYWIHANSKGVQVMGYVPHICPARDCERGRCTVIPVREVLPRKAAKVSRRRTPDGTPSTRRKKS
jgi:hypothetical protein